MLLDNEVIVALDSKAQADQTSRNNVANYLLGSSLSNIIKNFSLADKRKLEKMRRENWEVRYGRK